MDSQLPEDILKKLQDEENKPRDLSDEERIEMREGMALYEMVSSSPGWKIIKDILEARAFHLWADPRETKSKEEWEWQNLNAFHASNNAKELLQTIQEKIDKAMYLQKVATGEIKTKTMKI
jgi:hypothetical protein